LRLVWRYSWLRRSTSLSRSIVTFAIHHCHVNLPQTLTIEFNFERGGMDQSTRLTFLPAATNNRLIHSSDILSVDTTRKLFENLQSRYDYVLVDLTPLMPIVDTRATRAFVDCYVCVIEWGRRRFFSPEA
jgi:hypothetical protein